MYKLIGSLLKMSDPSKRYRQNKTFFKINFVVLWFHILMISDKNNICYNISNYHQLSYVDWIIQLHFSMYNIKFFHGRNCQLCFNFFFLVFNIHNKKSCLYTYIDHFLAFSIIISITINSHFKNFSIINSKHLFIKFCPIYRGSLKIYRYTIIF